MLRLAAPCLVALCLAALVLVPPAPARASSLEACLDAIGAAERAAAWLPSGLLRSIALIESGHRPEGTRAWVPWPWTINSPAGSFYLASRREAVAKVAALQRAGHTNIDVGCMQINLHYHPDAFRSLDDAFRPESNVGYAVRFLDDLRRDERTLFNAVGRYHSATPHRRDAYARKVFARWDKDGGMEPPSKHGLGEPDSPRLVTAPEPIVERPATRVWRGVYGTAGGGGDLVTRPSPGGLVTRSTRIEPTGPRSPGQIQLR